MFKRYTQALARRFWSWWLLKRRVRRSALPLVRLGSEYGGWVYAPSLLRLRSVAFLAGAGEDISFDLALQEATGATILIVDPTPRAIAHFTSIKKDAPPEIIFVPTAIWREKTGLRFYAPRNSEHVSHSITNLQGTEQYITVPADTFEGICEASGVDPRQVDLVKLDIEGAEHDVVQAILDVGYRPTQLLLEFDEIACPTKRNRKAIRETATLLQRAGYNLIFLDGLANCLFVGDSTRSSRAPGLTK